MDTVNKTSYLSHTYHGKTIRNAQMYMINNRSNSIIFGSTDGNLDMFLVRPNESQLVDLQRQSYLGIWSSLDVYLRASGPCEVDISIYRNSDG